MKKNKLSRAGELPDDMFDETVRKSKEKLAKMSKEEKDDLMHDNLDMIGDIENELKNNRKDEEE